MKLPYTSIANWPTADFLELTTVSPLPPHNHPSIDSTGAPHVLDQATPLKKSALPHIVPTLIVPTHIVPTHHLITESIKTIAKRLQSQSADRIF